MNVNPFSILNHDCIKHIMSNMQLSTLHGMSQTNSSFYKFFAEIFTKNRPECRKLLESGRKNKVIIEPGIQELKAQLVGQILIDKESFNVFAEAVSRRVAKNFSETRYLATYYSDPHKVIRSNCQALMRDEAAFTFLNQYGFSKHIAQAYIDIYKLSKNSENFLTFCKDIAAILGNKPAAASALDTLFEELYAGWKGEYYRDLLGECAYSSELRKQLKAELQTFTPDVFFTMKDVQGLALIDRSLLAFEPLRASLSQRLAADIPALFNQMEEDLQHLYIT